MLDWLTLGEPQRLLVSAAVLLVLGLILLAVIPSRDHDLIARRISALRPVAAPLRRHLIQRVERLATATAPLEEWLLGPTAGGNFSPCWVARAFSREAGFCCWSLFCYWRPQHRGLPPGRFSTGSFGGISILHWGCAGLGVLVGAYLPDVALRKLAQHRLRAIELGLPDALDLLVICAEAGLSFETALDRVAKELRLSQPALAGEFVATSADLRVSPDRDAALAALATRVLIKGMQTVVTALTHSMRYGTPLVQSLRVMASTLRK
jgi:hypothetical protein